jgi:NAD(P)H-nitrite reductase large subunit
MLCLLPNCCFSSQTVELKVGMTCGGCVGAVERVLKKTQGKRRPSPYF